MIQAILLGKSKNKVGCIFTMVISSEFCGMRQYRDGYYREDTPNHYLDNVIISTIQNENPLMFRFKFY